MAMKNGCIRVIFHQESLDVRVRQQCGFTQMRTGADREQQRKTIINRQMIKH
jgi:hypothetical protein